MKIIRKYFGAMPSLRRYDIDDDEWAYLALHVMAALERQKEKKSCRSWWCAPPVTDPVSF